MASPGRGRHENSMETILTFDNRDLQSQWSMVWSTTNITNDATARSTNRRMRGRRRLHIGSLALSALMTMHCRIPASALTGGFFVFMVFLVAAVVVLANPLRHFEVYLGQWSISGPGRAFRIIPMLDGIGIAMCINAIVRAITCCTIAAIAAMYVIHSVADAKLPFTYCRDFNLESYDPEMIDIKFLKFHGFRSPTETGVTEDEISTVGLKHQAWRNASSIRIKEHHRIKIGVCKETYAGKYPPIYSTPAYNFFYVEVIQFRHMEDSFGQFNVPLGMTIIVAWLVLWFIMVMEKFTYSRLIWDNIKPWFIVIPWIWTILIVGYAASNLTLSKTLRKAFRIGAKEIIAGMADALEVALYIHSLSVGTELIHGKGLNHFASGHIDPNLSGENVWHSGIVLMLTGLHSGGAAMCALIDFMHFNSTGTYQMSEIIMLIIPLRIKMALLVLYSSISFSLGHSFSGALAVGRSLINSFSSNMFDFWFLKAYQNSCTLWVIPMYSKCTSMGSYSHLVTALVFGGMMFSYLTVAFALLKTALHTIFEYRVKLVLVEQFVVAGLMLSCMGLSLVYATNGGIPLLESVNAIMTGVAMPFVLLLELVSLLYVYRSHDFQSDLYLATEDNTCASRVGIQLQIIPFVTLVTLIMKLSVLPDAEMPSQSMCLAAIPLVAVILALPLRAAHNAYKFLRSSPRRND